MAKEKKRDDWDDIAFTEEDDTEVEVKEEAPEKKEQESILPEPVLPEEPAQEGTVLAQAALTPQERYGLELGMNIAQAKMTAENLRLKAENAALKQQHINMLRTVGSASGAGKRSYDAFEEAWYDGN